MDVPNEKGPTADQAVSPQNRKALSTAASIQTRRGEVNAPVRKGTMVKWLWKAVTVGSDPGPLPRVVKPIGKKLSIDTLLTPEEAAAIVSKLAPRANEFALVTTCELPDDRARGLPLALCDSGTMTVAIPNCGVLLGSLVSELALLHVPGLGRPSPLLNERRYQKYKREIKEMVMAVARELSA